MAQAKTFKLNYSDTIKNVSANVKSMSEAAILTAASVTVAYLTGNYFVSAKGEDGKENPAYVPVEKITAEVTAVFTEAGKKMRTITDYLKIGHKLFLTATRNSGDAKYADMLEGVKTAKSPHDASVVVSDWWQKTAKVETLDQMKAAAGIVVSSTRNAVAATSQEKVAAAIKTANKRIADGKADPREVTEAAASVIPDITLGIETLLARLTSLDALEAVHALVNERVKEFKRLAAQAEKEANAKAKEANDNGGSRQQPASERHGKAA